MLYPALIVFYPLGLALSEAVLISRWSAAALMNLSLIVFSLGNMFACIEMILSSDIRCWSIQQLPLLFVILHTRSPLKKTKYIRNHIE